MWNYWCMGLPPVHWLRHGVSHWLTGYQKLTEKHLIEPSVCEGKKLAWQTTRLGWFNHIDHPGYNFSQEGLGCPACSNSDVGPAKLERHLKERHKGIRNIVFQYQCRYHSTSSRSVGTHKRKLYIYIYGYLARFTAQAQTIKKIQKARSVKLSYISEKKVFLIFRGMELSRPKIKKS